MQTILGSGGAIGIELAKALPNYTQAIRLVSRHPKKINETDHLHTADLLNKEEVDKAIAGSEIVYITVGFPYQLKIWRQNWPSFISNVIASCIKHRAKLVFFDNIYMYDSNCLDGMDENTPIDPPSKKGQVRAQIAKMIMDRAKKGELDALIARSADFYGPAIQKTSMLTEMVFNPLSNGKKANWLSRLDKKHSFTYTPDAGKATAILGNSPEAYGQVWHLPTTGNPPTGKEWIEMVAKVMGKPANVMPAPKWIVKVMGLFDPLMKELPEMMYQYDRDYVFNSDKFNNAYKFTPTSYEEGIKEVVSKDYS